MYVYLSDGKHQKLRTEFHLAIALGTCSRMCSIRSKSIWGEHISRRLNVSATCWPNRAIISFRRVLRGRPSALQWDVRHNRRVSVNEVKACFWFSLSGSSKAPPNTYDIAPLEARTKSTAFSLKVLVSRFISRGIQFASPPRSLLRLFAAFCLGFDSSQPLRSYIHMHNTGGPIRLRY